jgi:two-component system, LytTR family, sensor kinase
MERYLLHGRKYLGYYTIIWFFSALLQFTVLFFYAGLVWRIAAIDSLVSTGLLFVPSLAVWYVVRFTKDVSGASFRLFFNTMIAGSVILILSLFLSQFLLSKLFATYTEYQNLLHGSFVIRLITGISLVMIIGLYFVNIRLIIKTKDAAEREVRLKTLVQHTELQALKNQLNPHFIYNSLNAISSLTATSPEKARDMIIKLSEFLRYALKVDALQLHTLETEIGAIERYLDIEKVRFGERLKHQFSIDESHLACIVPAMILQPLYENAIKHGVQRNAVSCEIVLNSKKQGDDLLLTVTNPFDGPAYRQKSEGVGLENVRNRLRVIYGNGQLLQTHTSNGLFIASLILPTK